MDTRIASVCSRQYGLVTRQQILRLGTTDGELRHLLDTGRLDVRHPGVYAAAGSVTNWHQRQLAACLAVGPDAVASHRAAAHLWSLDGPFSGTVELTAVGTGVARPAGAVVHRSTDLTPAHVTVRHGVPVTDPVRTLVDLGAEVPQGVLDRAVDDALARRLVAYEGLLRMVGEVARRGRRGVGPLRRSLADRSDAPESVLEAEFERLVRRSDLPDPVFQHEIRSADGAFVARVDAAYPELRIAIELDGASTRARRESLDYDTQRQNRIVNADWIVLRFTWSHVVGRPMTVLAQVEASIRQRERILCFSTVG